MTYNKLWDKFMELSPERKAQIAEKANEEMVYFFKAKDLKDGFNRAAKSRNFLYNPSYGQFPKMVYDAVSQEYVTQELLDNPNAWCCLDLEFDEFHVLLNIKDLLKDYNDRILEDIVDKKELQMEILGRELTKEKRLTIR